MKTIKVSLSILILLFGIQSFAQKPNQAKTATTKTETFKVSGNCDQCKTRIEKAAKLDGVSKAEWNDNTKIFTLVYNPSKVTVDAVQKKIAAAGHDTGKYKADKKVYDNLPGCCQYR